MPSGEPAALHSLLMPPCSSERAHRRLIPGEQPIVLESWNFKPERADSCLLFLCLRPTGTNRVLGNLSPLFRGQLLLSRFRAQATQRYGIRILLFLVGHEADSNL